MRLCDIELRFDIDATRGTAHRELALQIEVDFAWYHMIALRINLMNILAVTIFLARVVFGICLYKLEKGLDITNISTCDFHSGYRRRLKSSCAALLSFTILYFIIGKKAKLINSLATSLLQAARGSPAADRPRRAAHAHLSWTPCSSWPVCRDCDHRWSLSSWCADWTSWTTHKEYTTPVPMKQTKSGNVRFCIL